MRRGRWGFAALLALACAAAAPRANADTAKLESYPRALVERPFVLPGGVFTWEAWGGTALHKAGSAVPFFWPLFFRWGANDRLTVLFAPVPAGLRWQIHADADGFLGVGIDVGFGYNSVDGFTVQPRPSVTKQWRLGDSWALAATVRALAEFRSKTGSGHPGAGGSLRGTYQISPVVGVSFGPDVDVLERSTPETAADLLLLWSAGRRWDLSTEIKWSNKSSSAAVVGAFYL
ncbi:MAG TPA: hypothetical protein VL588_00185 [Bdellovibrionota bacterium]|nr:hypothetical protein [Bdellovibrionota bacterium]